MADHAIIPPTPSEADYERSPEADDAAFFAEGEPFALFARWLEEAKAKELNDPNAMALATVDDAGLPDVRMVLLKDVSREGFTFYTNLDSAKGVQIAAHPMAALCFHWKSLRRQVRVRGALSPVSPEEADAYFATRARASQIGAWASDQSRPLESRHALEVRIAAHAARFGLGPVSRPPHWSGFRLAPVSIEFWRDRWFRLHDRLSFSRDALAGGWRKARLYP